MTSMLTEVAPWITAVTLAVVMFVAWTAGWLWGRYITSAEKREIAGKFSDGNMTLLSLMLAFTFSMALVKHEQRRQMAVNDSNAIGDFSTCADLLPDPVRGELQAVIRQYVKHRLDIARRRVNESQLQEDLVIVRQLQARMQGLVRDAVEQGTPAIVPLVNTLNALTSSHAARLAAVHDQLPPSIVWLLCLSAVVSMIVAGWQQGASHDVHPGATFGFIMLVSMVMWVTLDLNQPRHGWITVSQEPLEELLKSLSEPPVSSPTR